MDRKAAHFQDVQGGGKEVRDHATKVCWGQPMDLEEAREGYALPLSVAVEYDRGG